SHLLAANAEELKIIDWMGEGARPSNVFAGLGGRSVRAAQPGVQSLHKLRAVHFAGGFACRDQDSHRALYRGRVREDDSRNPHPVAPRAVATRVGQPHSSSPAYLISTSSISNWYLPGGCECTKATLVMSLPSTLNAEIGKEYCFHSGPATNGWNTGICPLLLSA